MTFLEGIETVMTWGIKDKMLSGFGPEIQKALDRHKSFDWGDLNEDDKQMNDDAVKYRTENGKLGDRLFSAYELSFGKIYIITEYDESVTTLLLPEEY